ncbi:MAG: adaptor protein MecA [Clostridia bacterium]|nr:adaptor protein MecA [Clostridia bacterium]
MDILRIGSDSIKISLDGREAQELHLDREDSEDAKSNFVNLMVKVKERVNFKVLGEKLVAEYFSGRDGGYEIFVSRLEVDEDMYKDRGIQQEITKRVKPSLSPFSLESFEKLLDVTNRLKNMGYSGSSSLYYDDMREKYYIILEDVSIKDLKYAFMTEYSKSIKPHTLPYIKEHFRCICKKDAVNTLSALK